MKKSLACTVLAGLLVGCVMTGAEAADSIDIVLDGQNKSPYSNAKEYGIGVASGSQIDFGSNISSIRTVGNIPLSGNAWGIHLQGSGNAITSVKGSSISEININATLNGYGIENYKGVVELYDIGKIMVQGANARAVWLDKSGTNIITFNPENDGLIKSSAYDAAGTGLGLYMDGGENYIGTYKDGTGNYVTGHELQGIDVEAGYNAYGIVMRNEGESVVAFGGKNSFINSTTHGEGNVYGIDIENGHSATITGLGSIEVRKESDSTNNYSAYGVSVTSGSDVNVKFDASNLRDTIKVVGTNGFSWGLSLGGNSESSVTGIKTIVVGDSSIDTYGTGICVTSGNNQIDFVSGSSIKVLSKSDCVYGIYTVGGTTTVTGLDSICVQSDGNRDMYFAEYVYGIYVDLGSLNVIGLKNISVNTAGDTQPFAINVYNGYAVIGGIDSDNLLEVKGNVRNSAGSLTLYDVIVDGDLKAESLRFDKKVIINGDVTVSFAVVADDCDDDFTFGKSDKTSSVNIYLLGITDSSAKIKINGNGISFSNIGRVENKGTLTFAGDCSVGNVTGNGTLNVESGLLQFTGDQRIENKVVIKNGASFDPKADYLSADTTVEAGGKLYVSTGTLSTNIKGDGTTYLQASPTSTAKETVTVNTNQSIEGTFNGSDGTIKLAGGTAYTLTVGKLAGITNLDVAVNFNGGNAVNGMMSIGAAESGAVLNVSNVNVTADIPDGTNNGVVTYATGAGVAGVTHKVNGQVGGSITASANKIYTFTQDMLNPGKLNWSVQTTSNPITFKEFIEGIYEGKPSTLSLTENMVDGPNGGTADSGLASQTNSVLNINVNNHNLGTNGNNFTAKVAGGKTINLNGGATGSTVYTNWDVANNGTFNMSGVTNMKGTISGSGSVNNEGTLNIGANNLQTALNNNSGVVNLAGGTLANVITGGQLNIVENVSAVADNVKGDVNSVASGKVLNLTAGSLDKNVGGEGSVEIGGTVAVNSVVQTDVTVKNGGILTADLQNLQSTVTNNGQFNMAGNLTKNIAGNGVTVLQNNIQPDNVTITGTLNGNGKTIDMQEQGGTAAYKTLTVGKLAGTTLLKIDADLHEGNNDNLVVNGDSTGAVVDVIGVNVARDVVMEPSTWTKNGSLTYMSGAGVNGITYKLNGSEAADASLLGTTATNNYVYTFTRGDAGKLNYRADVAGVTFVKFIQGELEGVPDTLSLTENMVDGPNGGTADSGLASQTNDSLYINLNGHTLGTEGNKFTVKVASGKTVYLSGGTGGVSRVYTSWTLGDVGTGYASMNTSGGLTISGDIGGVGTLNNDGTVTIGGNVNGSLLLTNSGSLVLDGRKINVGQITNTGEFVLNSSRVPGTYYLNGDVYHTGATRTEINLVGTNNNEGRAALAGRVYGSDNNFKMTLDRAEWLMDNIVGRSAPADFGNIHNVSLAHNANVSLNLNTGYHLDTNQRYASTIAWRDVYGTATFHNLRNDGTGRIDLAVDLANSVGDQIILQGETPAKLGVMLVNKDNNGDMEFVPDGVHKVTYAKAPIGSNVTIDTSLVPMYGKQSMIYTPIVETGENSDGRYWNFVGWNQSTGVEDRKSTAKDALDVPNLMPEMEEKRLEEIHRYAVHKDLSELGAWVRGETGKMSADGVDFDVKVISGGYDWANKTSKGNFFMGVGVSHGTSNADMNFVGDSKNTSFSVYGSWYGRKNYDYIDFVAKYGKIDHEYNGTNFDGVPCEGEYDKKMYSLFLKYGRRVPLKNGFYLEPFGSFTYGRIGDADFYDKGQGARMHVNAILSKIVSAGVMFGKSVKGTELYCKLAYSYDFDGEVSGSAPDLNYSEKTDMGGSSCKFAIGASRNLGKQNSLHLDLEKDFGGKMKRPWNLALTFKHTW